MAGPRLLQFFSIVHRSLFVQGPLAAVSQRSIFEVPAKNLHTAKDLLEARTKIFGSRIGTGARSGAKLLRKKLVGGKVASYYPTPVEKDDPLFVSLPAEAKKAKLEKLKRRGKAPPRKGQGKRTGATKRR